MRLIPGKTKVSTELFKGVRISDMIIGAIGLGLIILIISSNLPAKMYVAIGVLLIVTVLLVRIDTDPNYIYILHIFKYLIFDKIYIRKVTDDDIATRNMTEEERQEYKLAKAVNNELETHVETKEEKKARIKAEKAEIAAEDKILKSRKATEEEKNAVWLKRAERSAAKKAAKNKAKQTGSATKPSKTAAVEEIESFTGIKDGFIEYGGRYYGVAIEIPPVEFRFFSKYRRLNTIENCLGRIIRSVNPDYAFNIVKIDRPINYERFIDNEYDKLDELRSSYESGMIKEEELRARVEVLYDRIYELQGLCGSHKVVSGFYYIVLFDSDRRQLTNMLNTTMDMLSNGEMNPRRLKDKELAIFLKYTNQLDFDEHEIDNIAPEDYAAWAMPKKVKLSPRTCSVNDIVSYTFRIVGYPMSVSDAWMAGVMSIPGTKVVVKAKAMDREKSVRSIDWSLQELRSQYHATSIDSKRLELASHIDTLNELLATLQGDNEALYSINIYVTAYDIVKTRELLADAAPESSLPNIGNMKRTIRRTYQESSLKLNNLEFEQMSGFIGSQISGYDPFEKDGRGVPSNTVAAMYPWIYAYVEDEGGVKLGSSDGIPVFINFFRRDSERVNSNMVIVGKSGSGKSYATKSLLTNLAADDAKIFILDPENEYSELADTLHGKFINVGNAQHGRLNPFHIITGLDDDEATESSEGGGSYATHLQFLEEFFKQILPDCDKDAMEYLNSLINRMYANLNINEETDLSKLRPEDYPTFDDLYDAILTEFQSTDNEYIRTMLRTLINYISKFSTGGRNANIWNGPSSVTTEENFTVFNFQSLLANRNGTIANAQMLLVLKYIDNEIIKNRDYNTKYGLHRKVVVVIDEAHVFIDAKYPVALDFMFQLAKRIRKYNGMQIVITQNIKDFVGSEEIARKSTAIINACQYSFIFALAPNDMSDLCKLYEKAGGINEIEQEKIISAPRGQAFTIMSAQSRSTFKVEVPDNVVDMFQNRKHESKYFCGEDGAQYWAEFVGNSTEIREEIEREEFMERLRKEEEAEQNTVKKSAGSFSFVEISEEEADAQLAAVQEAAARKAAEEAAEAEKLAEAERAAEAEIAAESEEAANTETDSIEEVFTTDDNAMAEEILSAVADITDDPVSKPTQPTIVEKTPAMQPSASVLQQDIQQLMQPTVQYAQVPSKTEEMLAELLSKLSYETMMAEIKRTVASEMESTRAQLESLQKTAVLESEAVQDTAVSEEAVREENETTESSASLGSIFETVGEQYSEEQQTTEEQVEEQETEDEDEETSSGFDIMSLLKEEAEKVNKVSVIDTMSIYGESVIDIDLEELARYNATHR